jgi:hypothetical protein
MRRVVVFLGPSLPLREARAVLKADYRPPARQGDVFRALTDRPRALVLLDGVFEAQPSVWHQELRAALASGVPVFGGSSMGALRAAELAGEGMVPVGRIAQGYLDGTTTDDGEVALLHADAAQGYRPLTVPLVNVRATVAAALSARALTPAEARRLLTLAEETSYLDRRWRPLVTAALRGPRGPAFSRWLETHAVDQKALDARATLAACAAALATGAVTLPARAFTPSSFVRRRRLRDAHGSLMERLEARPEARALAQAGTRRLLLARFAEAAGFEPSEEALARALKALPTRGLSEDQRRTAAEVLVLEAMVLEAPERFVADGPALEEGLALEAQLQGYWRAP